MKNIQIFGAFICTAIAVTSVNAQEKAFKTDAATGVKYRFVKHDKNGVKPNDTDIAQVIMLWTGKNAKGDADSVYFDSHKRSPDGTGVIPVPLNKSFNGCLEQGVMMMAKGDSAIFHINGDSLFLKTFHAPAERIPKYITGTTEFTFNIKLIKFESKEQLKAEQLAERQKMMEKGKEQETADIADYLKKNNVTVKPDEDGIYYLQTTKGSGKSVAEGDSIVVKYKGTFLDGNVFDPGTRNLNMVYSKHMSLIQGWISVLGKMNGGDKVTVLIPSAMGYGAPGRAPIKPYTPLLFDMELVSVKSNK